MPQKMEQWLEMLLNIGGKSVLTQRQEEKIECPVLLDDKIVVTWDQQQDGNSKKYYIIALFSPEGSKDTLSMMQIEEKLEKQNELFEQIGLPEAGNSYLVLLYPVDKISNYIYKQAMEEEEISIQFKRYMLYYTETEFDEAQKWLAESDSRCLDRTLLKELELLDDSIPADFLKRVLIKIPFFQLAFTSRELPEFSVILHNKINGIRSTSDRDEALRINSMISDNMMDAKAIAETLFQELEEEVEQTLCTD